MAFPVTTRVFPLLLLLLILSCYICRHAIAEHDEEREALYALKDSFNNSFLEENWFGPQCSEQLPQLWQGIRCLNGRVSEILLEGMGLNGAIESDALSSFTDLSVLSLKNNSISGNLLNFTSNQKLKQIDLSGNKFSGPISKSLLSLSLLVSLQLQNNNLSGPIPEFTVSSLRAFNVSNNNLNGKIPETPLMQSFGPGSYSNNYELCGPPTSKACPSKNDTADEENTSKSSKSSKSELPIMFLLFDIVGLLAVILLFFLYWKKSRKLKTKEGSDTNTYYDTEDVGLEESSKSFRNVESSQAHVAEEQRKLTFMEDEVYFELSDLLKAAAEGLPKGILGTSYKALMEGKPPVVVKRLKELRPLTIDEFTKQLHLIGSHNHPNLLPLLAYFCSKDEKLLVYDYAEKGNLFDRIHGERGRDRVPFRWSARLAAARGVARALEYLHNNNKKSSSSNAVVPHGNLKSTNVLLGDNDMVLVSDYGLTPLIAQPIAAQRMVAYQSPEYQTAKRVSKKSDIWSFGCLLLELLTGRVSAQSAPPGFKGVDLNNWVLRAVREEWTAEIFDTEISTQRRAVPEMLKLLQIAIRCCEELPDKRPEVREVVREVESLKTIGSSEDEEDLSTDQSLTDDSWTMSG
ncbi:hypothetical protein K2173_021160 [Erythroxylum novogranatense]|uniref:Protein kinase domain-containing protein n=1 Tax=Erythroxylum novogranatense TaxID=1862640 RepID=A0AAV8TMQ8_9ROSI|nr:hypothetical protein K2173_021160 [Erythroxylum novogranatense]